MMTSSFSFDLSVGEPLYLPPPIVKTIAKAALDHGPMRYCPPGGLPKLREALMLKVQERNHLSVTYEQVSVTSGASMAITTALMAICSPNDFVLCPTPCFPGYRRIIESLKLQIIPYKIGHGSFVEWPSNVPKARVLLWNSPNNPTGAVASEQAVTEMLEYCRRNGVTVISDEIYEDIIFEGTHVSPGSIGSDVNIFSVYSFSKSYAMTGWRVGYLISPTWAATRVQQMHYAAAMSASALGQLIALGIIGMSSSYLSDVMSVLSNNRQLMANTFDQLGINYDMPSGAFFFWLDVTSCSGNSREFVQNLWNEKGILLSSGEAFTGNPCARVRFHFAVESNILEEICCRLTRFVQKHQRSEKQLNFNNGTNS